MFQSVQLYLLIFNPAFLLCLRGACWTIFNVRFLGKNYQLLKPPWKKSGEKAVSWLLRKTQKLSYRHQHIQHKSSPPWWLAQCKHCFISWLSGVTSNNHLVPLLLGVGAALRPLPARCRLPWRAGRRRRPRGSGRRRTTGGSLVGWWSRAWSRRTEPLPGSHEPKAIDVAKIWVNYGKSSMFSVDPGR